MKKKVLVPLIVFLLGICFVGFIVYKTDIHEKEQRHTTAQLNASTYGERIKNEITHGIGKMESLISLIPLQKILCPTLLKVCSLPQMVL